MSPAGTPGVTLTGPEAEAVIGLLRMITGWLDSAGPAARAELDACQRASRWQPPYPDAGDLPDQIARITAILRLRQWTEGYR